MLEENREWRNIVNGMLRLGLAVEPANGTTAQLVELAQAAEACGYSSVWTGEAYGYDAVTPLAWMAAHTTTIGVGTSIMQMPGRTPAMTAMTATAFSDLSNGRFLLGLGLSGPAVTEGWHGTGANAPLGRTREYLDIVGQALRGGAAVNSAGPYYPLPYTGEGATGQGAALRPMAHSDHPIPVYLAAIGPKNVALSAELTDGVLPVMWHPTRWSDVYGADAFDQAVEGFDIAPRVWVAVGEDLAACRRKVADHIAFYVGAMGPPDNNYYATLVRSFGYEEMVDAVVACYAERRRGDAGACVPDALVDDLGLVGPAGHIAEQLDAWRESPVGTMIVDPVDVESVRTLAELAL